MSLEQAIQANTEALLKLHALLESGKLAALVSEKSEAAAPAAEPAAEEPATRRRGRPPKAESAEAVAAAPKYTAEQVKAAAVKVKDALGTEAAKKLIADHGAKKLDELAPEKYEDFVNAAEKLLEGGDDDDAGDDDL